MTGAAISILYSGEGNPDELLSFAGMLNCRIFQANNLDTCMVKLRENQADILIVDLDYEAQEQFALLQAVYEEKLYTRIEIFVLAGGKLTPEQRILCLKTGALQILEKPLNMAEFALVIETSYERLVRTRQLQAQVSELSHNTEILGKYFSKDMKEHLLNNRLQGDEKGILTIASVLFFEIHHGSELAAGIAPDLFARFLSALFEGITALVYANHGSVSKYMGDGVLATFGYPVFYNNDIYNAVKCALEIRNFIAGYNETRPVYIKDPVTYGIGITTGKIFAGNVGSSYRKEHMVVGDTVSSAIRLQALTRQADIDLLIDEETHTSLEYAVEARRVKFHRSGQKGADTTVYCIINMKADAPIATALTEAELSTTYGNKPGEVEFF